MDSSTIIFIATLAIAFVFLRWLITPIPNSHELERSVNQYQQQRNQQQQSSEGSVRRRRQVTDSMIEVVQAIAPTLTRDQIIMDLNNTGSVELTIDRYMELGGLPLPPSSASSSAVDRAAPVSAAAAAVAAATTTTTANNNNNNNNNINDNAHNTSTNEKKPESIRSSSVNLLDKYNIDISNASASSFAQKNASDLTLQERKVKMVLDARSRYQQSLNK